MATSNRGGGKLVGLVFLVLGLLFLLENFTDWGIPWGRWWPVILIVVGIWNLVGKKSSWVGGTVMVALGGFFLLGALDVWEYNIGDIWRFWPLILILVGARILLARRKKKKKATSSGSGPHEHFTDRSSPGELDITSVFGSNHRKVDDQALGGGQVVAVFGAAEIDLRDASLAGGQASLDVTAVFGGVEIRLPRNWIVEQNLTNFLGGVDDKRDSMTSGSSGGVLTLTGSCVFAGIELKS